MFPRLTAFHLPISPSHCTAPSPTHTLPVSFHSTQPCIPVLQPSYLNFRPSCHPHTCSPLLMPWLLLALCTLPAKTWLGTWDPLLFLGHFSERWVLGWRGAFLCPLSSGQLIQVLPHPWYSLLIRRRMSCSTGRKDP